MSLIMVVEDQPGVRQVLEMWLKGEGLRVAGFPSAETALAWLRVAAERPVVALVDIKLPGINGFALADRLAADFDFQDVIFVTAFFWEEETRRELVKRGRPYFEKPFKFQEQVLPFLRRYLKERSGS